MGPLATLALPLITQVIDRVMPDPQTAADAKLRALEMAQKGELAQLEAIVELSKAQAETNTAEASGGDSYARRWRPTIGYVIGAALAFHYILNPLLMWAAALTGSAITPPAISLDDHLWELIMGMLGLAGWRTLDKVKGVSR